MCTTAPRRSRWTSLSRCSARAHSCDDQCGTALRLPPGGPERGTWPERGDRVRGALRSTAAAPAWRVAITSGAPHHDPTTSTRPLRTGSEGEQAMAESVYKIIELVGTSTESWEKAAAAAVNQATKSLRDLRIAEIVQLDMHMQNGKIAAYRAKVKVSFKFERE